MKFKVGDKVRRINIGLKKSFANMKVGDIGTITQIDNYRNSITLKEFSKKPFEVTHSADMFEVEPIEIINGGNKNG